MMYNIFTKVAFAPLDKLADEFEKEGTISDSETPEELEDALFIPFPGTIKQIPQSPYRGSDPEWQEYIKFSKDLELIKKVRSKDYHLFNEGLLTDCEQLNLLRSLDDRLKTQKGAKVLEY